MSNIAGPSTASAPTPASNVAPYNLTLDPNNSVVSMNIDEPDENNFGADINLEYGFPGSGHHHQQQPQQHRDVQQEEDVEIQEIPDPRLGPLNVERVLTGVFRPLGRNEQVGLHDIHAPRVIATIKEPRGPDSPCEVQLRTGTFNGKRMGYISKRLPKNASDVRHGINVEREMGPDVYPIRHAKDAHIPPLLNVYTQHGETSIAMGLPDDQMWYEATPGMNANAKFRVLCVYQELHARGILHGSPKLGHILVSLKGNVTLLDYSNLKSNTPVHGIKQRCTRDELENEQRFVRYLLDWEGARRYELHRHLTQVARINRNKEIYDHHRLNYPHLATFKPHEVPGYRPPSAEDRAMPPLHGTVLENWESFVKKLPPSRRFVLDGETVKITEMRPDQDPNLYWQDDKPWRGPIRQPIFRDYAYIPHGVRTAPKVFSPPMDAQLTMQRERYHVTKRAMLQAGFPPDAPVFYQWQILSRGVQVPPPTAVYSPKQFTFPIGSSLTSGRKRSLGPGSTSSPAKRQRRDSGASSVINVRTPGAAAAAVAGPSTTPSTTNFLLTIGIDAVNNSQHRHQQVRVQGASTSSGSSPSTTVGVIQHNATAASSPLAHRRRARRELQNQRRTPIIAAPPATEPGPGFLQRALRWFDAASVLSWL